MQGFDCVQMGSICLDVPLDNDFINDNKESGSSESLEEDGYDEDFKLDID